MREKLEYCFFQLVKWFVLILPLKSAQRLGRYLGGAAFYMVPARRAVALENLQNAFPQKSIAELTAIAKGAFRNYGIMLVEFLWFPNLTDDSISNLVHVQNIDLLKNGFARGKGMVMLSGHFGNWELIALAVASMSGLPFTSIVQNESNEDVDSVIKRHRCLLGNTVIPMGMSIREILKTLRDGGVVAIAPDQSGPMEGVFVEFFGRRVATHQGPAVFALRAGSPMQIGFMIRQDDGTYRVVLEEVTTSDLSGPSEENILELTQRHTALLEEYIRRYPDHWLWMHRRWKHTWESVQEAKMLKKVNG